jgi:hypothetical protein
LTRFIPGYSGKKEEKADEAKRFEEVITGWCVLSGENPTDRAVTIKTIGGGVGETFVKFQVTSKDSGHGNAKDKVNFIVWGQ